MKKTFSYELTMRCSFAVQLMERTHSHVYYCKERRWIGLLANQSKNQSYQIILALNLTALNFNSILTIDCFPLYSIQKYKIRAHARSLDDKSAR